MPGPNRSYLERLVQLDSENMRLAAQLVLLGCQGSVRRTGPERVYSDTQRRSISPQYPGSNARSTTHTRDCLLMTLGSRRKAPGKFDFAHKIAVDCEISWQIRR